MPDRILVDAVNRQGACVYKMLREAIAKCPEDQWRQGRHDFFIPARLAFHAVQSIDFHLDARPKEFPWNRFGIDWEECPAEALLSQPALLDYLDEVQAKAEGRVEVMGVEGLLGPDYAGFFPTALEHVLYTLRHVQHHLGQINAELKTRGLSPAKWR